MIKCKKCQREFSENDIWELEFMGSFCVHCALYVLGYWIINAEQSLAKIQLAETMGG